MVFCPVDTALNWKTVPYEINLFLFSIHNFIYEPQLQGFAELEYGMLRYMGAIDDSTMIVTTGEFSLSNFLAKFFVNGSDTQDPIHILFFYLEQQLFWPVLLAKLEIS
jgi:hypothetical protein